MITEALRAAALAVLLAAGVPHCDAAADPAKVLHVELRDAEASLDPALATDVDSLMLISALHEGPLVFDYLARPVRVQPGLLVRLPQSDDGGLHWRLELRAGLRFAPDAVFGSAGGRAISAEDLRFSLQRLADPALHSPWAWLMRDHVRALEVRDARVLELVLQHPEPDFPMWLALPAAAVVPPEAARAPGGLDAHPVGAGPYRLATRVRGAHYTLLANPAYRPRVWDATGSAPELAALAADMRGRPVPAIGRIEVSVIEEPQAAWLTFSRGGLDLLWLQDLLAPSVLGALPPGVRLDRINNPDLNYFLFNLRDAELGGMQPQRIALRRAVLMALDPAAFVREVRAGQGEPLAWPVPSGLPDQYPGYQGVLGHDPAAATALLDLAGFRVGADHFRHWPDGRRLTLRMASRANAQARTAEEFVRRAVLPLGIALVVERMPLAEFVKAGRACQFGFAIGDWDADGADGEEFFARLSPDRVGSGNYLCPEGQDWQQAFDSAQRETEPARRRAAWARLARSAELAGAWKPAFSSWRNVLVRSRVHGFHSHPFLWSVWQYLDVD